MESKRLNEQRSASSEDQQAALSQASQNVVARTKAPVLPGFVDGKNNLDGYLLPFERYATVAGWERSDWATSRNSQEYPSQFVVRISNYFDKWVELAGGDKTFKRVSELMVREQFTNSCPKMCRCS